MTVSQSGNVAMPCRWEPFSSDSRVVNYCIPTTRKSYEQLREYRVVFNEFWVSLNKILYHAEEGSQTGSVAFVNLTIEEYEDNDATWDLVKKVFKDADLILNPL